MSLLSIKNLQVHVGSSSLVHGISLSLEKGKTLCVVGESGSGKTLTALSVMGLLADGLSAQADEMMFDGIDLQTLTPKARRLLRGRSMSMIFQEPMTSLNPVMRVGAQVAEVFAIHTTMTKRERVNAVLELFRKVQLHDEQRIYESYPHQLSGGQRQRVMIAMALAMKPKLLIADEPTTALDVTVQGEILALIKSLQQEMNMAVLFVTHDFGVVKQIADDVLVMEHGKKVEEGKVKQLLSKPKHAYTKKLLAAMPQLDLKAKKTRPGKSLLEARGLRKVYTRKSGWLGAKQELKALDSVDLSVLAGQTVGVVGESGSGKSTLARCLVRLIEPDSGQVVFLNEDLLAKRGKALRAARKHMQMVFQDPFSSLNPRMKVGESVGEGLRAHTDLSQAERRAEVVEILSDCGLPSDSYDRYPHQFSGGQRQRICIARALALKPKLVVCDEATSSLDVSVQGQILALLADLKAKYNLSYLFISHDLRIVSQVADEVLVMQNGRVVEAGPVHQVFGKPKEKYTKALLAALPGQG